MIKNILKKYPKKRSNLSDEWKMIHTFIYKESREGNNWLYRISQLLESWMHYKVSNNTNEGSDILEIGAGTLNHIKYENKYSKYDIIEPFIDLYKDKKELQNINNIFNDIKILDKNIKYDKIISIAVLEHVEDLPNLIALSATLLKNNGIFRSSIPSEGGVLWGLSWRISVGIQAKIKYGLDYSELMKYEHINDAEEIIEIIKYFYQDVKIERFPFNHNHLSLYTYINASNPDILKCNKFLKYI